MTSTELVDNNQIALNQVDASPETHLTHGEQSVDEANWENVKKKSTARKERLQRDLQEQKDRIQQKRQLLQQEELKRHQLLLEKEKQRQQKQLEKMNDVKKESATTETKLEETKQETLPATTGPAGPTFLDIVKNNSSKPMTNEPSRVTYYSLDSTKSKKQEKEVVEQESPHEELDKQPENNNTENVTLTGDECDFEHFEYINGKKLPRRQLRLCLDAECSKKHALKRPEKCKFGDKCNRAGYGCQRLHPIKKMPSLCSHGVKCINYECEYRHPPERRKLCNKGRFCEEYVFGQYGCKYLHPKPRDMAVGCKWQEKCEVYGCKYLHPVDAKIDCPEGAECEFQELGKGVDAFDDLCENKHPKKILECKKGVYCSVYRCKYSHPNGARADCPDGLKCQIHLSTNKCEHKHPRYIYSGLDPETGGLIGFN